MSQQCITAIQDMGDGIDLVLAERDFWVHAAEIDVTAIILTGSIAVEQDIIGFADGLAPLGVLPNPLGKGVID